MEKQCSKCKSKKPFTEFFKAKRYKDGCYPSCKKCCRITTNKSILKKWGTLKEYYAEYRNRIVGGNPRTIYSKKKNSARNHGITFAITIDEFVAWYADQDLKCSYCDIPQELITQKQWMMPNCNIHRLTIDRMKNENGYVMGNICLCCSRCNLIKSNIFSFEEARKIGQEFIKPKWEA